MKIYRFHYGDPIYKETRITATRAYTIKQKFMGQIVVAGIYDTETTTLQVGYARCHPDDNYSKRVGKELALRNAENSKIIFPCKREEVAQTLAEYLNDLEHKYLKRMR